MRNYKKKNLLTISFVTVFILTLVFLYLLNTIKLWTFNSYSIIDTLDNEKIINILIFKEDLKSFRENSFFYYDAKKYYYEIKENSEYEEGIILTLSLKDKISLLDDKTLFLPNIRKNVLSLIMDSWRSK